MKRTVLTLVLLTLASMLSLNASNERYGMDEVCYESFLEIRDSVGKPSFNELNSEFLKLSIARQDKEAELMSYVLKLRNAGHGDSKEAMLASMEELLRKSREYDSERYYFFAYTRTLYYLSENKVDDNELIELIKRMLIDAREMNSDYGKYEGNRYLALISRDQKDILSERKYAKRAHQIYCTTNDPIIKEETLIIRTLIDCSETYKISSDSLRFYLDEARRFSRLEVDNFRCDYFDARYYAVKKDVEKYRFYRSRAESCEKYYDRFYPDGRRIFYMTDCAIQGKWNEFSEEVENITLTTDKKYLYELARAWGRNDIAMQIFSDVFADVTEAYYERTNAKTAELSAYFGNIELSEELNQTEIKLNRAKVILIMSTFMFLLLLISAMLIYYRKIIGESKKREKLIEELEKSKEEADKSSRMKTMFVQNMSHEIRTPLNAIVGFSQLMGLPDGFLSDEEKAEYAEYILNNSSVLTMLIDDILNIADIENGNYKINIQPTNCALVCKFAMKTAEPRLQSGVEFVSDIRIPQDSKVMADPARVQQILINLLTNACKNTEKGSITVTCSDSEKVGYITFAVTDTGIGVPPEKAEFIFERFSKLNCYKPGTGLGLSICKMIANMMDGDVYLDTTYTSGARFIFEIPEVLA